MLRNIKISSPHGYGRKASVEIDGVDFPVTDVQYNLDMENMDRIVLGTYVKSFEFDGKANLILNGVLVDLENERRLYEQLKEKFEDK